MDLIYTDADGRDAGVVPHPSGDFSIGRENSWEISAREVAGLDIGCLVYIDGQGEFGGVVDEVATESSSAGATYSGRTWHGMLASMVACPGPGEDRHALSGDANACIAELLGLCGDHSPFRAAADESGIEVSHTLPRYCDALSGLNGMLSSAGAALAIRAGSGGCELRAVPSEAGAAYSDSIAISMERRTPVNHLVCLGSGELADRTVVHLYADREGRVSRTQSIFGPSHMAEVYDYSNAKDEAELVEKGTERLKGMQEPATGSIDDVLDGSYSLGQELVARDEGRGHTVSETVTEKIARVSDGAVVVECKTGSPEEGAEEPA